MGRMGTPEDAANVAEFFAGELSTFVSGQMLIPREGAHSLADGVYGVTEVKIEAACGLGRHDDALLDADGDWLRNYGQSRDLDVCVQSF